jgi:hypothetical protein
MNESNIDEIYEVYPMNYFGTSFIEKSKVSQNYNSQYLMFQIKKTYGLDFEAICLSDARGFLKPGTLYKFTKFSNSDKWSLIGELDNMVYNIDKHGFDCDKCKQYFEHAKANQSNGGFMCWGCRNGA